MPIAVDLSNLILDPGFEAGTPNPYWDEYSLQFGTPICDAGTCGQTAQRNGDFWAWFGGYTLPEEEAILSQTLVIPDTAYELSFWLRVDLCDSPSDYIEVLIDDNRLWILEGGDPECIQPQAEYFEVILEGISAYADNSEHMLEFHARTFSVNSDSSDFHVDDIFLPRGPLQPIPSACSEDVIFADGFE